MPTVVVIGTDWSTFAAAVSGGLIGLAGIGASIRVNRSNRLAELQRSRFERVRELYARMAEATESLRLVIREQPMVFAGETKESRDESHDRILRETQDEIGAVGGLILVDPAISAVRDTYAEFYRAADECIREWRSLSSEGGNVQRIGELTRKAETDADRVIARAREELAGLEMGAAARSWRHAWRK